MMEATPVSMAIFSKVNRLIMSLQSLMLVKLGESAGPLS